MHPTIPPKYRGLVLATLLFAMLVSTTYINAAPDLAATGGNWYSLHYDAFEGSLQLDALGLDAQGNGWLAQHNVEAASTLGMLRIQGGRASRTDMKFKDIQLSAIRLSADGSGGWAIGSDGGATNNAATRLLRYGEGKWSEAGGQNFTPGQRPLYQMVLDRAAMNGWAAGVSYGPEDAYTATLLHLSNGAWQDATSLLPDGVDFSQIAADPDLQHVWAAGLDRKDGDAALYYWDSGKWVSVSQPVGHYEIVGLAVDAAGNGWAILAAQSEPVSSPTPTGLLRLHPDHTWKLIPNAVVSAEASFLSAIALDAGGNGWAMGHVGPVGNYPPPATILRLAGDTISNWQTLNKGAVGGEQHNIVYGQAASLLITPAGDAWATTYEGGLLHYATMPMPTPALAPILTFPPDAPSQLFDTGYAMSGPFLDYWNKHGGLRQFGLPLTPLLLERLGDHEYAVQYTERARFEYHPENPAAYRVQLGLLGNVLAEGRGGEPPFQQASQVAGASYFAVTGHNLSGPIGDYWQKYGGLAGFGYPISEAFIEQSPTDGKSYTVQYFERNRLEYHPENRDPQYKVLLGLLGSQQYQRTYGGPPPLPGKPLNSP